MKASLSRLRVQVARLLFCCPVHVCIRDLRLVELVRQTWASLRVIGGLLQ